MIQNHQQFKVSLKILLKNKSGKILILKSASKKWFKDFWDLPGGRIDKKEVMTKFHKLIKREIKEEIGSNVKYKLRPDPVSLSKYRFPSSSCTLYILFEAKFISGKIKISKEHLSYKCENLNKISIEKIFHKSLKNLMINYFDWNY